MAEGWGKFLKSDEFNIYSAGLETHGLNPYAVRVMSEVGVDIIGQQSQLLSEFDHIKFDYVITVCSRAHETCPIFPRDAVVIHYGFEDPPKMVAADADEETKLDAFRAVRDQIQAYVETLPQSLVHA
jgi:arsenate reductase